MTIFFECTTAVNSIAEQIDRKMTLWTECCVFGEEAVEGLYVSCDLKQSEQKEKGSLWVVAVDAGLSYERTSGLKFHDAIEELASPVVPGVLVSACTIQLLANSEQHQLECARSIRHLPPSASRARLKMRTPLLNGRMTWIAEWLLHEVADVTWGGEGHSVWKPCWQEIAHVRTSLSWMLRLSRFDGGLGLWQLVVSQLSGWSLAVDCFHSLLKSLFWSGQIDRARWVPIPRYE